MSYRQIMKNIKLIVTDMDGTFLNSKHEMSPEFPEIYDELKKRNILFVPASGRQMFGITQFFNENENEMAFIAENGGYIKYQNEELFADHLSEEHIPEIINIIRNIDGATVVISRKQKAYFETDNQEFADYVSQFYKENEKINDLLSNRNNDVFKIAIHHPEGAEEHLYPYLKEYEKYNLKVVVSGKNWLDIMNKDINKGQALEKLQQSLGIKPEETMVFGDYMNDIEMLKKAHYSFAMENAHPSVKEAARFQASCNNSFGVLATIKDYLSAELAL
ncbi:Cof-type HAD-IIB family hydrolase [Chryseobacterium sp. Leaf180]|uniref:Cof-type HAD-IIB family hydrolase n=1 Tax=Chryseobacterium sp. Leaf180 TaxID=1736289 RepID=UPI001EE70DCD|nr:Cof-type HAD-IIB family hydrolase [Chryseobacterium sp. Leaf180]